MTSPTPVVAAFVGNDLLARGSLNDVASACKACADGGEQRRIAVFDDDSGRNIDLDLSGSEADVLARLASSDTAAPPKKRAGPGRPKLGVVSREISLLPGHWEWLATRPGGASATLRRLVHEARKQDTDDARSRAALDAVHRFLWDIAGDLPNYEDTTRALYAADFDRVGQLTSDWPAAIREQLTRFLDRARAN